jgi:hypothetical protein
MIVDTVIKDGKVIQQGNIFNATLAEMFKSADHPENRKYIDHISYRKCERRIVIVYMGGKTRIIEEC